MNSVQVVGTVEMHLTTMNYVQSKNSVCVDAQIMGKQYCHSKLSVPTVRYKL